MSSTGHYPLSMAEASMAGESVPIDRLAEVMDSLCVWWAVAGGVAIDLRLGKWIREHAT